MRRKKQSANPFSLFSFQDIITATTGILILLALVLALSVVMQKTAGPPAAAEFIGDLEQEIEMLSAEVEKLKARAVANNQLSLLMATMSPEELENKSRTLKASIASIQAGVETNRESISRLEQEMKDKNVLEILAQLKQQKESVDAEVVEANKKIAELESSSRVVYNFRTTTSPPHLVEINGVNLKTAQTGQTAAAKIYPTVREFVEFAEGQPSGQRYFLLLVKPSGIKKYELLRPYLEKMNAEIGVELIGEDLVVVDPTTGGAFQ